MEEGWRLRGGKKGKGGKREGGGGIDEWREGDREGSKNCG